MISRITHAYRRQPALLFCLIVVVLQVSAQPHDTTAVNQFLDQWHQAAAEAKAEPFFQAIADDGIYIGTADFERWTKAEFENFAMPYFKKGKAWDFRPYNRDIHFSPDGRYAWFSELLSTWMGVCRGSGIVVQTPKGWKIHQYHLSVTVPNEIIDDFIKLVDGYHRRPRK